MRRIFSFVTIGLTACSQLWGSHSEPNPDRTCVVDPTLCAAGDICEPTTASCVPMVPDMASSLPVSLLPQVACDAGALIATLESVQGKQNVLSVIPLSPGCIYTLTAPNNYWLGPTGLPPISSPVEILGNGAGIQRDPSSPPFRLFVVGSTDLAQVSSLTLRELTLKNGKAVGGNGGAPVIGGGTRGGGGGGAGLGGAIFSLGKLVLDRVSILESAAIGGDGTGGRDGLPNLSGGGGGGMGGSGAPGSVNATKGTGSGGGGGGFRDAVQATGGNGITDPAMAGEGGSANGQAGLYTPPHGVTIQANSTLAAKDGVTGPGDPGLALGGSGGFCTGSTNVMIGAPGMGGSGGSAAGKSLPALGGGGGGPFRSGGGGMNLASGNIGGGGGAFGGGGGGGVPTISNMGSGGGGGGGGTGAASPNPPRTSVSGSGGFGGGDGVTIGDTVNQLYSGGGLGAGGAVFVFVGSAMVVNSTLAGNQAQGGKGGEPGAGLGGAIFNLHGNVSVIQSTLINNKVSLGAALAPSYQPSPIRIAARGSALFNLAVQRANTEDKLTVSNSVVINNLGGPDIANDGLTSAVPLFELRGRDLIGEITTSSGSGFDSSHLIEHGSIETMLNKFDGRTPVWVPDAASPLIGAGAAEGCSDPAVLRRDQLNRGRPSSSCTVGAVEVSSGAPGSGGAQAVGCRMGDTGRLPWAPLAALLGLGGLLAARRRRRAT